MLQRVSDRVSTDSLINTAGPYITDWLLLESLFGPADRPLQHLLLWVVMSGLDSLLEA